MIHHVTNIVFKRRIHNQKKKTISKDRTKRKQKNQQIYKMQIARSIQIEHNWHYFFFFSIFFFFCECVLACASSMVSLTFTFLPQITWHFLPHTIRLRFDCEIILQFIKESREQEAHLRVAFVWLAIVLYRICYRINANCRCVKKNFWWWFTHKQSVNQTMELNAALFGYHTQCTAYNGVNWHFNRCKLTAMLTHFTQQHPMW